MRPRNVWVQWSLLFFVLAAIIIRWSTYHLSVINHDESTYILIGKGLWEGQTYLVDSYDTKPIGIFLIYALLHGISGGAIWLIRLLTSAVIGLTAWLIYRLGGRATGSPEVAWAAGIGYLILPSIFTFFGISPNTELFFVPCAVGAILLVWEGSQESPPFARARSWYQFALAGLLLGIGFAIKYVIAADALALGLYLLWHGWKNDQLMRAIWQRCLPMTLAFFVAPVLVLLYYQSIGQLDTFFFYTFEVTSRYPESASLGKRLLFVLEYLGRFFPFTFLAGWAIYWRLKEDQVWQNFLLLWLILVFVIVLVPGKFFGHYQIQLMPATALLMALYFHPKRAGGRWLVRTGTTRVRFYVGIALLGLTVGLFSHYWYKKDGPREVAALLTQRLSPGDLVYTGNYHHITYYLLGQEPMTPYVHSSLLFYPHHIEALQIDMNQEIKRIFDQNPRYVLLREEFEKNSLTDYILTHYESIAPLPDRVNLYQKKQPYGDYFDQ